MTEYNLRKIIDDINEEKDILFINSIIDLESYKNHVEQNPYVAEEYFCNAWEGLIIVANKLKLIEDTLKLFPSTLKIEKLEARCEKIIKETDARCNEALALLQSA